MENKISISTGNKKMGAIPSISLPPVITCATGCTCAKKCYAARLCRIRANVREAYQRNLEILEKAPNEFWEQVESAVKMARFFRFHVSGDFPTPEYFEHVVEIARRNPHCELLAFTKRYNFVNGYISDHGGLPQNLRVIMSEWPGMDMENPYNLPVAHVIFKGQEPSENWKICGGNCLQCACRGVGCWQLTNGEHIAFYEH